MRRLLLAALLFGCLPEDTRDPPGMVTVNVRGTDATIDGIDTLDGWRVTFERVLVAVGAPRLPDDDSCSPYSDGEYLRVVDGMRRDPEKLGILYGLGSCGLGLRAGNPGSEALLGVGVTEADKTSMREPGSDAHVEDAGVTFLVRGRAARGAQTKTFEWIYRRRFVSYVDCALPEPLRLAAGSAVIAEVRLHAPALFEDDTGARFDPIAAADADGNGAITLAELDATPSGPPGKSLGAVLYDDRFPHLVRVGDRGLCKVEVESFGGDP